MYMSAISKIQDTGDESQTVSTDQNLLTGSNVVPSPQERDRSGGNDSYKLRIVKGGREQAFRELDQERGDLEISDSSADVSPNRATDPAQPSNSSSLQSSTSDDAEQTSVKGVTSQESGSAHQSQISTRLVKEFLSLDRLSITTPSNQISPDNDGVEISGKNRQRSEHYARQGIPGSFSTYSTSTSSYSTSKSSLSPDSSRLVRDTNTKTQSSSSETTIRIHLGEFTIRCDLGLVRLMIVTGQQLRAMQWDSKPSTSFGTHGETPPDQPQLPIEIRVDTLAVQLVDVLRGSLESSSTTWNTPFPTSTPNIATPSNVLLVASFNQVRVSKAINDSSTRFDISAQACRFGYASEDILSFDRDSKLKDPTQGSHLRESCDVVMSVEQSQETSRINLSTHALKINLDLAQLDETFGWFGGLSGVLELGNSMMSTVTVVEPRPKTTRPRGVRFDEPRKIAFVEQPSQNVSRIKFDARIGGLLANVQGKDSSLLLKSTPIKIVSRPEGIALQVEKIKFSGPHILGKDNAPIIVDFSTTRFEYLTYPQEKDIDRLLNLLSPSRDKEEQDDGILLDTLISQRQQGGVIRLTVEACSGTVSDTSYFDQFSVLGEEFAKLSTVAKYLPEDDRPGILALCLVRKLNVDVHVNARFGSLKVIASNTEIAQVTFPSLFLLAADTIRVTHDNHELIGEALPVEKMAMIRKIPSVGVRFVGDEMEPTIKVKLWNTRVDYHVSTLMAIMGLEETVTGEIIVADMVSSIATVKAHSTPPSLINQSSFRSGKSSTASRNMAFEVSVRESALGLNPRKSPSGALFLVSDARINGNLPGDDRPDTSGILSIHKASLMIVDKLESLAEIPRPDELPTKFISQASNFLSLGYVSVCEISAAKISWKVKPSDSRGEGSVEVEIRDELFVLETCADSTHTLQSVMNGLNPPSPPSMALKYRTEVGPVQDMLASLSADGFLSSRTVDATDDPRSGNDNVTVADDDTAGQINLIESVFGLDSAEEGDDLVESYLDDDFETLARPSAAQPVQEKPLLESYLEQQQTDIVPEELEFHDDHFGDDSGKGKAHKWNSDRNTFETSQIRLNGIPFRLIVKDVHVIWNLYDGYDWQTTRDTISQAVADVEHKAAERLARLDKRNGDEEDEESVIGDFLFNSIYIGIPANRDPRDLAGQVNRNIDDQASETGSYATSTTARSSPSRRVGSNPRMRKKRLRLGRSKRHKMSFELKGVSVDLAVFAPGSSETQSSVDIRVEDLDIFDNVPTSAWRKFATYMHDAGQRQTGESMVHIEILTVKPVPDLAASEIVMTVRTIIPTREHSSNNPIRSKSSPFASTSTKTPSTS